jgi:formate dehydrogenase subunit gamma
MIMSTANKSPFTPSGEPLSDSIESSALTSKETPLASPEPLVKPRVSRAELPAEGPQMLLRYSTGERLAHWGVAISYVLLFLSGLALFHPFFFWTSALFGSGPLMRILHPFLGVALAVLFYPYAARLWRDNRMLPHDREWLRAMFSYINRREGGVPEVEGKYNAGQKLMCWSMIGVVAALVLSGVVLWQPYFAPSFSATTRQAAALVHVIAAFVMFVGIGVHVYAAYWTKGSMKAMTRGTVTRAWARMHHPGWHRQMVGKALR